MSDDFSKQVIKVIESGNVKMRPRWYFVMRDVLAGVATVILLLMAVYLASFIVFILHQDGAWFVPVFGLAGWYSLFNALPWVLILLTTGFVISLALFGRRYASSYQWPLLYSLLGIFFLVAAASFLFVQTSFSQALFDGPISRDFPFLNEYYPGFGILSPNDIHRGVVIATTTDGFLLEDAMDDRTSSVVLTMATTFPVQGAVKPRDAVVVFGERNASGTILAAGVETLLP